MTPTTSAQSIVPDTGRFYFDRKGRLRIRRSRSEVAIGWFFIIAIPLSFVAMLGVFAWAVAAQDGAWTLGVTIPGALLTLLVFWVMLDA